MHYLYGTKPGGDPRLVATFDSEQQLQAYVRWATLQIAPDGKHKFEQGSALVGCTTYQARTSPLESAPAQSAVDEPPHNPTPSML